MIPEFDSAAEHDALLSELLESTSRTFAVAIPCLPMPARREVTIAYLLFRIADTIEDGTLLDQQEKLIALDRYDDILVATATARSTPSLSLPRAPSENQDYLELIHQLPRVVSVLTKLDAGVRDAIVRSTRVSVRGMKRFIANGTSEGRVRIGNLAELREYCYVVAGVVGEMLTEIFVNNAKWLEAVRSELDANDRWFGEGLQLVNVLKDSADDADDGRHFIPEGLPRKQLFDLAREDLARAESYVQAMQACDAPGGMLSFVEVPLQLAWRTLECVEERGPGSKVPRDEVMRILGQTLSRNTDDGSGQNVREVSAP